MAERTKAGDSKSLERVHARSAGSNPAPSATISISMPQEKLFLELLPKAVDITDNSKEVKKGSIFFAIKGTKFDGHTFLGEVLKKSPLAVVVEKSYKPPKGLDFSSTHLIKVENTRKSFAKACKEFFGKPDQRLKVFGITGTNGKTSTSHILAQLLENSGCPTGIIGTVEYRLGSKIYGKGQTTPHPKVWFKTLTQMLLDGAKAVSAEISSHALYQYRIYSTNFEGVVLTNLSQDHLDYHLSMEEYYLSKKRLFTDYQYKVGITNIDNPYGRRLFQEIANLVSFGKSPDAHYRILDYSLTLEGSKVYLQLPDKRKVVLEIPLLGEFQIYNTVGAFALLHTLGWNLNDLLEGIKNLKPIPGRFEVIQIGGRTVIIDYAHTPDALDNLLRSVKKLQRGGRLITLFGAGGNRDKTKRPLMGKVASKYSDILVITSDNPRWEEPQEIINHILEGVNSNIPTVVEVDRRKAIKRAILEISQEGDIIVIAGKGHEDYQEIKGVKYPFSDRQEVLKLKEETQDWL